MRIILRGTDYELYWQERDITENPHFRECGLISSALIEMVDGVMVIEVELDQYYHLLDAWGIPSECPLSEIMVDLYELGRVT